MKMSRRAKRMQRNHKRLSGKSTLNLTALMDIFTILVFFLMVNQSEVQVQNAESVDLPKSVASNKPEEQLTVLITRSEVLVQGRRIMSVSDLKGNDTDLIPALQQELAYHAERTPLPQEYIDYGRPITVVGDKSTPYSVLKKVMNTCAKSGFINISLAVNQTQEGGA